MTSSENGRQVTELELSDLAEKIDVDGWRKLGLWLDIREAALSKYERENWFSGAASTGTYKMLCDWKKNCPEADQRQALTTALQRCELGHLAREVLKESPRGIYGPEIAPIRNQLISYAKSKLLRVPLIPWAKTSYIQIDAIFISVQLVLHVSGPDIPVRYPLDSYNDILTETVSDGSWELSTTRFVVRGKAGSGKTTLMIKLLSDWCRQVAGSVLGKCKLVFYLPMRKLTFQSNLGESIVKHCLPRDARISAREVEQICHENAESVFILLDGYDEFPGKGLEGDDAGNIVGMLRNEEFIELPVLVTTRPGRLDDFQEFGEFKHLEVTGFTQKHVEEYIHNTFTGTRQQIGTNLYAYLDGNNLLSEVASVPLLLCAFCQVAKRTDGIDFGKLSTYTALFERLVKCFFQHELAKPKVVGGAQSPLSDSSKDRISIMSEEFLFDQLGKVALMGFFREMDGELLFSEDDFTKCCKSPREVIEKGCLAGLLTRDDDVNADPWEDEAELRLISFVLKTVQEMFAGRYLARLVKQGELDIVQYYLEMANSVQRVCDLGNVLMFACGQSMETANEVIPRVVRLIVDEEGQSFQKYWNGQLHIHECRRVQEIAELCLNLNYESQCEGKFNECLQPLFSNIRLFSPTQRTAKTLGYLLQHSDPTKIISNDSPDRRRSRGTLFPETTTTDAQPSSRDEVDSRSTCHDSPAEALISTNARLNVDALEIIHMNRMFDDQFRLLRDFLPQVKRDFFQKVNHLSLNETSWSTIRQKLTKRNPDEFEYIDHLSDNQFLAYLPVKEELKKWQVNSIYLNVVLNGLRYCSVKTLVITGISQECKKWRDLFESMESPDWRKLVKLDLSRNNIPSSHMSLLARVLHDKPNLKHLDVSGNVVNSSFVSILPDLPNLRRIYLNSEQMEPQTLADFGARLRGFPMMEVIDLNDNPLDDSAAAEIGDGLLSCPHLGRLRLDLRGVSDGGIKRLAAKIKFVRSLTHLGLYKHRNGDELVKSITSTLGHLPKLISLSLTGKVDEEPTKDALSVRLATIQSFTRAVTSLQHIEVIELFHLKPCGKGFMALLSALEGMTSLREFRVAGNCLPEDQEVEGLCRTAKQSFLKVY
ncbi:uncharacterized protein [Diadema setosum]|uniref:uncharacterized protein n=1 Tax=Diadema setosum TaxID=31175 RepID=UPI003B3A9A61